MRLQIWDCSIIDGHFFINGYAYFAHASFRALKRASPKFQTFSMDITSFLIALFLVRSIRSTLQTFPHPAKWDQWIKGGMTFIVFLLAAGFFTRKEHLIDWVWIATLLGLIYVVDKE
ncbi:hypothetical protein, partial [uncultured Mucilaginibacter sp.]|uniref:hypothetical protein n=1 Tax=uncultured Mucilaginibacter sp. TaxID=797541 RepID=UPI00260FF879